MQVKRSVQKAATCTTRAVLVECSLCCIDNTLITCQPCIGIRAKHQDLVSSHFNLCALFSFNSTEIWIHISLHEFLRLTIMLVLFL